VAERSVVEERAGARWGGIVAAPGLGADVTRLAAWLGVRAAAAAAQECRRRGCGRARHKQTGGECLLAADGRTAAPEMAAGDGAARREALSFRR